MRHIPTPFSDTGVDSIVSALGTKLRQTGAVAGSRAVRSNAAGVDVSRNVKAIANTLRTAGVDDPHLEIRLGKAIVGAIAEAISVHG